jgi:hypothetical protein
MGKSMGMRWTGTVARMGEDTNAYNTLATIPVGNSPLRMPGCRWNNNIARSSGKI